MVYGLTIDIPKIAKLSIMTAGIVVIMASFDMFYLSHTSIFSYSSKNKSCKLFQELIV
jgi:hypothetical protein